MYQVGETVLCPLHGAGIIEKLEKRTNGNKVIEGFLIKIVSTQIKIFIPLTSVDAGSVRPLIKKETAQELIIAFPALEAIEHSNWNKRYRENMDKILSGDIYEVAKVYKILLKRSKIKSLSAGERKMLQTARQILLSELNVVLNKDMAILEEEIKKDIFDEASVS